MSALWVIASLAAAGGALYDSRRRPLSQWVAADRNRSWWTSGLVVAGVFMLGLFMGVAYLALVVPRLESAPVVDPAFRKGV